MGGIFNRDGLPVECECLETMRVAMNMDYRVPDGFGFWTGGCARLGQSRFVSFPDKTLV